MSKAKEECDIVVVSGDYHPYRIGGFFRNPKFDDTCRLMLNLKEEGNKKQAASITYFGKGLSKRMQVLINRKTPITIAIVPGHAMNSISTGLSTIVANHVRPVFNVCNKELALRRHTTVAKRAAGGDRSMESVLKSVGVVKGTVIPNGIAILLDDVTTTGNSLRACAQILRQAGASRVFCFALMRTVHD